mmetsp:Transcript_2032/g.4944  ORF Transcript_2032/g.4944 Transcript_2032/m.4944 type:complete len:98 (+) Transcript_2032:3-296(+)
MFRGCPMAGKSSWSKRRTTWHGRDTMTGANIAFQLDPNRTQLWTQSMGGSIQEGKGGKGRGARVVNLKGCAQDDVEMRESVRPCDIQGCLCQKRSFL